MAESPGCECVNSESACRDCQRKQLNLHDSGGRISQDGGRNLQARGEDCEGATSTLGQVNTTSGLTHTILVCSSKFDIIQEIGSLKIIIRE